MQAVVGLPAVRDMNIFVDESGTFRTSPNPDSWCTVAAYACPETDRKSLDHLVGALRADCANGAETKLSDIPEPRYARFLLDLSHLRGIAFAVAVDAHRHTDQSLRAHQEGQAAKVIEHVEKMHYPEARIGLQELADAIRSLPLQLYAQLVCQVELFHKVIARSVTYYAQRQPPTLGSFRWRVDRKDTIPTAYETAFRRILPALLQTKSLKEPMLMLTESANYTFFRRFEYPPGEAPTYLKEDYGIDFGNSPVNIGKMVRDDFKLVDSAKVSGVQVADLLASGIRRVMRGNFDDPVRIATLIGGNLLQEGSMPFRVERDSVT
jgi:hypothetical protein